MPAILSPTRVLYTGSKSKKTAYCYRIPPGKVETPQCPSKLKEMANKAKSAVGNAGKSVGKTVGKGVKKTTIVWPIKFLLLLLDILAAPYGRMRGKDLNPPLLWKAGSLILVLDVWIYLIITTVGAKVVADRAASAPHFVFVLAQLLIPGALFLGACSLIIGGIRLQQGKSFLQKYGAELEPLPAFETGIVFKIGHLKLSLQDMHTNVGAFGGIGTGKTVSVMIPLMRQFFQQLNHDTDDPGDVAQKVAALILDEKGDFIDSTIMEMMLSGRPITDLVLIDPDLDLFRYNPLDPSQSADENAEKLGKVQKILGGGGGGDSKYWDDTSKATIKSFLQLLEVYKPKEKIGLDDIARFMRDDQLATILCDEVEAKIEEKKEANEINEELYGMIYDAISSTRNQWIELSANTKSILKTTINQMLSSLASNPRLQKVFCRDTNFSFKDLPNKGKIVLFRGSGIDKATAKLICVCLKIDFQTWQKRRNGSAASAYGLNTTRTVLFICDEYQEFVTCGDEGDQTFYGVSRSAKTCAIVATQSLNSLKGPIKSPEQTSTLIQNITTWIFLRTTDKDTMELGAMWAGQSKQEDFSQSQNTGGLIEVASNLSGGSGKDSSVSISRKLEENFRKDDFSKLITMTMEKSRSGPWYSEAIVYHYHDTDAEAESRCYKTKLPHYYYSKELRKKAGDNVSHLDNLLYDRNWQRKTLQRALVEIGRERDAAIKAKKAFLEKMQMEGGPLPAADPKSEKQARLLERAQENMKTDTALATESTKGQKLPGEIAKPPAFTKEDVDQIKKKRQELYAKQQNATSDEESKAIEREIGRLNHMQAMAMLTHVSKTNAIPGTSTREVLEANKNLFSTEPDSPEEEPQEATPETTPEDEAMWDPAEDINAEDLDIAPGVLSPYNPEEEIASENETEWIREKLNSQNEENTEAELPPATQLPADPPEEDDTDPNPPTDPHLASALGGLEDTIPENFEDLPSGMSVEDAMPEDINIPADPPEPPEDGDEEENGESNSAWLNP